MSIKIKLEDARIRYNRAHTFQVGDVVQWKKDMKHKRSEGPFVVMELIDQPLLDRVTEDAGTPYYREPLDVILGTFNDMDGTFICFHMNSRRFEPFVE